MKIHITNLYNFNSGDELVSKQHRFAEAGRVLGFYEMGVFAYPVETDTAGELSKRLDGVIAALEPEDLVYVQLPTENGYEYERLLLSKIKSYRNTKVVLVLHDLKMLSEERDKDLQDKYCSLFHMADAVIAPTVREAAVLKKAGVSNLLFCDNIQLADMAVSAGTDTGKWSYLRDFYLKKVLIDAKAIICAGDAMAAEFGVQNRKDEVQIGFGLYDKTGNYSVWVGVAMQSIMENTDAAVCFHILHDETLNQQNRKRLTQVAANGGQRVLFHFLDKSSFSELTDQMGLYTIGALFRIMLPEMLPELKKIIYLDADILANRDIKELWDADITNYCLAAVPDADVVSGLVRPIAVKRNEVQANRYFNSGVLYMNLQRIREKGNMREAIVAYLQKSQESNLPDQDALNAVYGESTLLLDGVWNTFVRPLQNKQVREVEKRIYHYVGSRCILYSLAGVDRLYYETTGRTPWGEEECRKQLDKSLNRITDRINQLEKLLHCCADGNKMHIFYGEETYAMRNIYQLLSIREGDYRVVSKPREEPAGVLPCRELSSLLQEESPYVVLVLPDADGGNAIANLEQMGLENEKDFFVIPRLLPPSLGGYM